MSGRTTAFDSVLDSVQNLSMDDDAMPDLQPRGQAWPTTKKDDSMTRRAQTSRALEDNNHRQKEKLLGKYDRPPDHSDSQAHHDSATASPPTNTTPVPARTELAQRDQSPAAPHPGTVQAEDDSPRCVLAANPVDSGSDLQEAASQPTVANPTPPAPARTELAQSNQPPAAPLPRADREAENSPRCVLAANHVDSGSDLQEASTIPTATNPTPPAPARTALVTDDQSQAAPPTDTVGEAEDSPRCVFAANHVGSGSDLQEASTIPTVVDPNPPAPAQPELVPEDQPPAAPHPGPTFAARRNLPILSQAAFSTFRNRISTYEAPTPQQPKLKFEISDAAAAENLEILKSHDFDLAACLADEKGTPLAPGSEFKPPQVLCPLLINHPLWPKVQFYFTHGVDFAMDGITEDERIEHNATLALRGNHKGANVNAEFMWKIIEAEVKKGWLLVLPLDSHLQIPNSLLGPLGLVFQKSIDETGKTIEKERPTHDLSFNPIPDVITSVNGRVVGDDLTPCKYGQALVRFIHYIIWLRIQEPEMPIYLTKTDWKAAYRRLHNGPYLATRSIIRWEGHEFICLRMTFGGSPFPNIWNDFAETACDLANDLARSGMTAADLHTEVLDKLPPEPHADEAGKPFAKGVPTAIPGFPDTLPRSEVFIDDKFAAFLERDWALGRAFLPFVIDLFARHVSDDEPLPRDPCLSLSKFLAEATPEETKVILGWLLNTRDLTIALPPEKVTGWTKAIQDIIDKGSATYGELRSLIGRLNHVGYVVPGARHFLGNLRKLESISQTRYSKRISLKQSVKADLELWKEILQYAGEGMSLNLLTTRSPNHWWRSDACEHGIGGYNLKTGQAWQWEIPEDLRFRVSINVLEFIGNYVNFCLAVDSGDLSPNDIVLLEGDNTSAVSWLYKTNANDEDRPVLLKIAREVARLMMQSKTALCSRHLEGKKNDCADCLSRDTHLSHSDLTQLLFHHIPEQLTEDFAISPLPQKIVSQLSSWLAQQTQTKESSYRPTRSGHCTGTCGCDFSDTSSSTTTHTSTPSSPGADQGSGSRSQRRIGLVSLGLKDKMLQANRSQAERLTQRWEAWQRPLGLTNVPIPLSTRTDNGTSFYNSK